MSKIEINPLLKIKESIVPYLLLGAVILTFIYAAMPSQEKTATETEYAMLRQSIEFQPTIEQRALLEFAVRDITWYGDDVKKSVIMCNSMALHNITGDITAFDAKCSRWFGGNISKAQCECVTLNETVR